MSESRSRSSSHVKTTRDRCRCYRCNEYDHFAENVLMMLTGRNLDDAEGSLLRMSDTDQTYAVNKELSASNGIMSIKKIVTPNKSEETDPDNAYQKALITGIENEVEHSNKKGALHK